MVYHQILAGQSTKDVHGMSGSSLIHEYRGFTPCQVKHHVQIKFVTPILYFIDNFKKYDFFVHIHH
jgi:hypothetical protein